jgi:hypothetical protein
MKLKRSLSMDSQKKETLSGRSSGLESEYHSTPDTVCLDTKEEREGSRCAKGRGIC